MLLYNGFDTLVFSTTDLYLHDPELFSQQKLEAGLQESKEIAFQYSFKGKGFVDKYEDGEKVTKVYNICSSEVFIMRSTSFNPFAWTFTDPKKRYLFSMVFSDNKKIFQVRVLAKTFMIMSWPEIVEDLGNRLRIFGIDVPRMKVKRIDWATDISYRYKKMNWFLKDNNFTKCYFTRYGSLLKPVQVVPYSKNYGGKTYCTGFMLGSKSVKLRIYDKVLESLEKYKEDQEKNEMVINKYYYKDSVVLAPEIDPEPQGKHQMDLDTWNECLLRDYVTDKKYQVIRFEYQLNDTFLKRKFKYLSDLNEKAVKELVYTCWKEHTGMQPEYIDRDFKRYEEAIKSEALFYNQYDKDEPTLRGKIIHAVRRIGGGMAALGINLSQLHGKAVPYGQILNLLDTFNDYFHTNYADKMLNDTNVTFSNEQIQTYIKHMYHESQYQYSKGNMKHPTSDRYLNLDEFSRIMEDYSHGL